MAIEVESEAGGIGVVTLAGRDRDGYLHTTALLQLAGVFRGLGADPAVRVVVVRGLAGHFCRGRGGAKGLTKASDVAEDLNAILAVNAAMDALRVPVITAIEGEALGFGFGLAAQSDYAVAAEDAVLALPEMSHGLPPLIVLSYLFRFVPYKRAFELALSSRPITAREAQEAGVVTEIVPPGAAVARAIAVARMMVGMDAKSLALLRSFAREAADAHSPQRSAHAVALMSVLLSERAQEQAGHAP